MSFNTNGLTFRVAVSLIIVLIYSAVVTQVARHYSIPLPGEYPSSTSKGMEGFYVGKVGGAVIALLLCGVLACSTHVPKKSPCWVRD